MDIEKYTAGKKTGISGIELHEPTTLLVRWPDGFDPETGEPMPPKEQGYQLADIEAMAKAAQEAITAAEDALIKAQDRALMFDGLVADAQGALK